MIYLSGPVIPVLINKPKSSLGTKAITINVILNLILLAATHLLIITLPAAGKVDLIA
ncbi:hypothetical protein H1R20_g5976, partial [Candolleomyces eurysporus]